MGNLVFLEPDKIGAEPFTTSEVIAENTDNKRRSVVKLIQQYQRDIEELGKMRFKIAPLPSGQSKVVYELNEQQAYFLMTLLRNTRQVVEFKKNLVKAFFLMRSELQRRQIAKFDRKPVRLTLTEGVKALPETPHKTMWYKHYTDLIYKTVIGKTAKQLREDRGAPPKTTASDYMTAEEIEAVTAMENRVAVLIEAGMKYEQVKAVLAMLKLKAPAA